MPAGRPRLYTPEEAHQRKLESMRKAGAKWRATHDRKSYHKKYDANRSSPSKLLRTSRENAKKKGYNHDITIDDIVIQDSCPCCEKPMVQPSLDRVKNELGYVKGNVCVICWPCNANKRTYDAAGHRMIADYIDKYS